MCLQTEAHQPRCSSMLRHRIPCTNQHCNQSQNSVRLLRSEISQRLRSSKCAYKRRRTNRDARRCCVIEYRVRTNTATRAKILSASSDRKSANGCVGVNVPTNGGAPTAMLVDAASSNTVYEPTLQPEPKFCPPPDRKSTRLNSSHRCI